MTKRIEKFLAILKAGGKVRYGLETDRYTGYDKFKPRLLDAKGCRVPGFGFAAYYAVKDKLRYHDGNGVATYYVLTKEAD